MYNPFSLQGKSILVTGASSGIGRAVAIECSKMGAKLILSARNKERLHETSTSLINSEIHRIIPADLTDNDVLSDMMYLIDSPLDGIVHCAGITNPKPFSFISSEDISKMMKINFEAPVMLTQHLLKRKKITSGGSIVFISSISGVYISSVGGSLYSASKGAIHGIVKAMALELASKSIRVNCINPGMIDTNIFKEGIITKEQLVEDSKRYPLRRHGKPEEVAYAAIYLLSAASQWVTGTNIVIDGGYTLL
ncbi:SDR family NAD(P)-dependent oxidoreductase [Parabacteroides pacaensis]|uniref:SDR family NAD(P)-dependent oxidoreductase n=1 Tax=Parabacteroides pacaensis TaxID=2086575 RepID=UPI000D0F9208|nr:SDR family oxidoreductase [Parabacteroides pacaensis]